MFWYSGGMTNMTMGAYFLALREEHKTPRGKPVALAWVARRVSNFLHREVHSSTIARIEKGGGLGGEYMTALLHVLGGDIADIQWILAEQATPEQAKARARETFKRTLNSTAKHRAAVEDMWHAIGNELTDEELEKELTSIQSRRKKR